MTIASVNAVHSVNTVLIMNKILTRSKQEMETTVTREIFAEVKMKREWSFKCYAAYSNELSSTVIWSSLKHTNNWTKGVKVVYNCNF